VRVLARPRWLQRDDELAYLMRVLRNTFLSGRRTASRRPHVTAQLDELELADQGSADRPEHGLEAQELYGAIAALPEDFRLALVAVDILGLSYSEAGRALGAREATITTRLHRARRKVVQTMDGDPPREGSVSQRSLD
jgi:RNA polymerase sigma-70 factor (ECF subfamily)